jgi:hypothetical protein
MPFPSLPMGFFGHVSASKTSKAWVRLALLLDRFQLRETRLFDSPRVNALLIFGENIGENIGVLLVDAKKLFVTLIFKKIAILFRLKLAQIAQSSDRRLIRSSFRPKLSSFNAVRHSEPL